MTTTNQFRNDIGAALWAVLFATSAAAQLQPQSAPPLDPGFKSRATRTTIAISNPETFY